MQIRYANLPDNNPFRVTGGCVPWRDRCRKDEACHAFSQISGIPLGYAAKAPAPERRGTSLSDDNPMMMMMMMTTLSFSTLDDIPPCDITCFQLLE